MNIQKNELLLLNKIKFGAKENENVEAPIPEAETQSAEAGMRALSFQGMKNLMSNPMLAQKLGVEGEETNADDSADAKSYVAPYSSNIAFGQAVAAKYVKTLVGAAVLSGAMVACQDQRVTVDLSEFVKAIDALMEKLDKIIEQNENNAAIWRGIADKIDNLSFQVQQGILSIEDFKTQIAQYFRESNETNKAILEQLEKNGRTEEEAKEYLEELLDLYINDRISLADLLGRIEDILGDINQTLNQFFQKWEQAEVRKANYEKEMSQRIKNLEEYGKASTEDLSAIRKTNDSLLIVYKDQAEAIKEISKDVKENNKITEEAKQILIRNGYTQAMIARWSVSQVTAKLDEIAKNTEATYNAIESSNAKLDEIYKELIRGNISEAEAAQQIIALLQDIYTTVKDLCEAFFAAEARRAEFEKKAAELLESIDATGKASAVNIAAMKQNTDSIVAQNNIEIKTLRGMAKDIKENNKISEEIKRVLIMNGFTQAMIAQMSVAQISAELEKIADKIETTNTKLSSMSETLENLFEEVKAGRLSAEEAAQKVIDLLGDIYSKISAFYDEFVAAKARFEEFASTVESRLANIEATGKATAADVAAMKENTDSMVVQHNIEINSLREIAKDVKENNKISEEAKNILIMNGFTQAAIARMSVAQITAELNKIADNTEETNKRLRDQSYQLEAIRKEIQRGNLSEADAAKKIIALLKDIDTKLDTLIEEVQNLNKQFASYRKESKAAWNTMIKNQKLQTEAIKSGFTKEYVRQDSIISLLNQKKDAYLELKQAIENGDEEIVNAIKNNTAAVNDLKITQTMTAREIIAKIDFWAANNYRVNVNQAQLTQQILTMLKKYAPFIENNNNAAIQKAVTQIINAMNINTDAVIDAMNENNDEVVNKLNEANTTLKELSAKLDAILAKIDAALKLGVKYGDKFSASLTEIEKSLKALDLEMPDLTVLTNYVLDLTKQAKNANSYLDLIAKKQVEINNNVIDIKSHSTKGLTKAELEEALKNYGETTFNNYKAYMNAIHAEDIEKADEIIGYLKKGNQISLDVFNMVNNWIKNADQNNPNYTEILNKIHEYLPNLICQCHCQADVDVNEGIKGDIEDLLK